MQSAIDIKRSPGASFIKLENHTRLYIAEIYAQTLMIPRLHSNEYLITKNLIHENFLFFLWQKTTVVEKGNKACELVFGWTILKGKNKTNKNKQTNCYILFNQQEERSLFQTQTMDQTSSVSQFLLIDAVFFFNPSLHPFENQNRYLSSIL